MNEDPFYEKRFTKRVIDSDERARAWATHQQRIDEAAQTYVGYRVNEPPWWRPFARRRYRLGMKVLADWAALELTPPPS